MGDGRPAGRRRRLDGDRTAPPARSFGGRLVEAPRSFVGSTSISDAIDFSVRQLERAPFTAERRVIDISGDGNNNSGRSVTDARDEALAKDITINALVILTPLDESFRPEHTNPPGGLEKYFQDNVIGGSGRVHRRRRKPRGVRPVAHEEADPGDRGQKR